ncbi:hypothetical protein JCM10908_002318 [Rhodotorula pacifica]|uniref:OTU domain-containing protein n=1 Tax=Rhodotorula pacifica TaxID=1495444 RepID=UPI003177F35C
MGKGARNAHVKGKTYGASKARDRTRAEKPKLIEDPELEEKVLNAQLREAGLYAANILGDGNCLFRALADQLYGSPSMHLAIRHEICDYLAANADRYRLFVDEDSVKGGFDGHVREMRQPGTYGTNIELSAFVARYRRPVKVYQPNLVYVMPVEEAGPGTSTPPSSSSASPALAPVDGSDKLTPRERRMLARAEKAKAKDERGQAVANASKKKGKEREWRPPTPPESDGSAAEDTPLCIVYHSWEHYSSLRNIDGPHTGPPRLRVNRVATSRANTPSALSPGDEHAAEEEGEEGGPDAEEPEERDRGGEEDSLMAEAQEPPPPEAPPPPRRARRPRQPDDSTDHPLPSIRKALERALPAAGPPSPPPQPVIPVIPPSPRSASPSSPPSTGAPSPISSDRPAKHLLDRSRPRCNSDASSSSALAPQPSSDPTAHDDSSSNFDLDENDNENEHPRTRSRLNSPASWSSSGSSTGVASSLDSGLSSSSDATSPAPADKDTRSSARVPPPPPSTARTAPKRKSIPAQRVRRGPTAREKKELARQRRMDRRRARGLNAQPVGSDRVLRSKAHAESPAAGAPDAGLSKVRELYI